MQSLSAAHGRFVWFELMTLDVPAAVAFYGKVVGWETEPFGPPSADPYQMWKMPGQAPVGGVMKLPDAAKSMGAPPHWMGNLCVSDVDAAVGKVKARGGAVYQGPFDVPGVGRVAIVADPWGASFALFQPAGEAPGHTEMAKPGENAWSELYTADPDGAWAFYSDVAGWEKKDTMDMGPMGVYQTFGPSGANAIGGLMRKPEQMPVSAWGYYTAVANLGASIATAKELGAQLINGPMEVPGGAHVATLVDPQGAVFSLLGGPS